MTINSQFTFDARDAELRKQGLAFWNNVQGPRVGDYVLLPCKTRVRISLITSEHFQIAKPRFGASYYWAWWYCSFSGGHRSVLYPKGLLQDTSATEDGDVWVFHHDQTGPHRGVSCTIPCRVYRLNSGETQ